MTSWRVFLGMDETDPEWTIVDRTFPSWSSARLYLLARLVLWSNDDCPECVSHAMEQIPSLCALAPGEAWDGDVEGDEYVLVPA